MLTAAVTALKDKYILKVLYSLVQYCFLSSVAIPVMYDSGFCLGYCKGFCYETLVRIYTETCWYTVILKI